MTLDFNTVKTVSIIAIGVLVLVAVLASVVIGKIVTKVITVALVLGLAVTVYVQRDQLTGCLESCSCTFFGQQVDIPQNDLVSCPS